MYNIYGVCTVTVANACSFEWMNDFARTHLSLYAKHIIRNSKNGFNAARSLVHNVALFISIRRVCVDLICLMCGIRLVQRTYTFGIYGGGNRWLALILVAILETYDLSIGFWLVVASGWPASPHQHANAVYMRSLTASHRAWWLMGRWKHKYYLLSVLQPHGASINHEYYIINIKILFEYIYIYISTVR